ncbi:hypothetical protein [Asticcacaulis sp.]|uniref:hypothetical protein n=1 Tax=Asticcacaulis sp. TaxID=1872648 RepID=UPI003F7BDA7F
MPQQQALFIGVIDLSVRLSSMNPIKMLDVDYQEEHLEGLIIRRIRSLIEKAGQPAINRIVIRPGMTPKQFEFEGYDQFEEFVSNLQWDLLSQSEDGTSIPFKMCVGTSRSAAQTLAEAWAKEVDDLENGHLAGPQLAELKSRLRNKFATDKPKTIKKIIALYQAEGVDSDRLQLSVEMESFKGMGFHAVPAFLHAVPEAKRANYFVNYFPIKRGPNKYSVEEFLSLKLDIVPDDLIKTSILERYHTDPAGVKHTESKRRVSSLDTGSKPVLTGLFKLLRRSISADEANGIYYVSMFNCFIVSSNYKELTYNKERVKIQKSSTNGEFWDVGWYGFPPIFDSLILDTHTKAIVKRIPAKEMLLASLLGAVYRDMPLAQKVFMYRRLRLRIDEGLQREIDAAVGAGGQDPIGEANGLNDIPLTHLVTQMATSYGKATMRAILNIRLPGVTDVLQKFVLNAVSTDT